MTCNCGSGDTPEYYITLDGVGVEGYSPKVNVVDDTSSSFKIEVVNKSNTQETPAIPKLAYLESTYATNTDLAGKLNTNGSNAVVPFTIGNFRILSDGNTRVVNEDVTGYLSIKEIRPRNTSGITIGYTTSGNYPINLITNDKAYYNGNEIATINNLDTRLKTDGSNADNGITLNGINLYTTGTNTSIGKLNSSNILQDGINIKSGQVTLIADRTNYTFGKGLNLMNGKVYYTVGDGQQSEDELAVKGDIPTVGNGTITLTQNGVTKGTFTTNQSGNTTIELDAGGSTITNPLHIGYTDEIGTRSLNLGVDETTSKVISSFSMSTSGSYFGIPIKLLTGSTNPLTLTENPEGLYTIGLNIDSDTLEVNQDGELTVIGGGGSSYTAGTGIDITNDTISVDSTVVALQSDLPTNYLTTDTSQTITTGTKTMASGTSQVFVSGSSLDVRGNNTLFLRGASQAQGGYLGLAARSKDTVNDVAINVIRLQANTTGDLANLRLQGYDLYNSPYLYNGFTRLGQVNISSGDINITTGTGTELQYNGNEVATVNDIPDLSTIDGGNA